MIEDMLEKLKVSRRVALKIPHFSVLPSIIPGSEMIACLPSRVAGMFAESGSMRIIEFPIELPTFEVEVYWKIQLEDSIAQQWFSHTIHHILEPV